MRESSLECLQVLGNDMGGSDLTVLERQRARLKWMQQQQQQQERYYVSSTGMLHHPMAQNYLPSSFQDCNAFGDEKRAQNQDSVMGNGWPDLAAAHYMVSGGGEEEYGCFISRNDKAPVLDAEGMSTGRAASSSPVGKQSGGFNKRKANGPKLVGGNKGEDSSRGKRIRGDSEEAETMEPKSETQKPNNNKNKMEDLGESSKENSKGSEAVARQKPDYIHVRARRGQATDSHSLAERVRREKISERMKYLQDLVPGCDKITGKAGMLDEIINYVQSLQRQVEFLSMKLATVNPRIEFNIDNFFSKEMNPACSTTIPTIGMSSELVDPSYLQFNHPLHQAAVCCGLDVATSPPELALRRTMSAPVSVPDPFLDACINVHGSSSAWDTDLQSIYNVEFHQGRASNSHFQSFQGNLLPNNLKMEM